MAKEKLQGDLEVTGTITGNATSAITAGHLSPLGTKNSGWTWGTLTTTNSYSQLYGTDQPGGGGLCIAEKDGRTSLQIDGDFYGNEGNSKVSYEGHTHDYAPKLSSTITANTASYIFPTYNANGLVTGIKATAYQRTVTINGTGYALYGTTSTAGPTIWGPITAGTAGYILMSGGGSTIPYWTTKTNVFQNSSSLSYGTGIITSSFTGTTDTPYCWTQMTFRNGLTISYGGKSNGSAVRNGSVTVSFGLTYTNIPTVVATPASTSNTSNCFVGGKITSITTTGFTYTWYGSSTSDVAHGCTFIAIGYRMLS